MPHRRYPHLELNRSMAKFIKMTILAEFAGFFKIAASSIPLSRAQSLFGEIFSKSPISPNLTDSSKSPLCRYPYLYLNRSSAKFVKIAIFAEFAGFVKIAALSVPLSRAQSVFGEISSKSPFSPNLPDSSKSPLCRYPYLELNQSWAKFRQNHHSRRICRIRQNRRFVGTPISTSIALRQNLSKSPFSPNSPDSPLRRRYPHLDLNRSSAKLVKIAILPEFAGFVKIAASSVPQSRAQSLFGEISSKSPFSPNLPDSSKSPHRRYPYLELNQSSAKFRQNHHSRRICRIRQNRRFVGTPISTSIALRRNLSKIAILAEFAGFATSSSVPPCRPQSLFGKTRQNRHLPEFAGFVKIAASSVPQSRAQSLFGEISSKSPFSPNSPDSSKSPLCRYRYLELNRSSAKFRQNRHSGRICRIRQNRRFVGTPILSSIDLRQNFVKIAILAEFAGFVKIAASSVPPSLAQLLYGEIRQNRHSRRIRRIRQNRRSVGTPILSSIALRRNFVKIAIFPLILIFGEILSKLPNSPLRTFLDISQPWDQVENSMHG